MWIPKNLVGMRFGRLVVESRAEDKVQKSGYREVMWSCICDCGNSKVVRGKSLTSGVTSSCGCLAKERVASMASKHHGFGTRLYAVWNSMRQRCNNPNNAAYHNYGGRGISICEEWGDFASFRDWSYQSGYNDSLPKGECTLDRIDVDRDYSPDNCRWISMKDQCLNKRNMVYLTYNGATNTLMKWSELTGVKYCTIWKRYKSGMSPERILKPV